METIILASASPRRRELLEGLGVKPEICPAQGEENVDPALSPEETVKALALQKALEVQSRREGLILAADTVVELDGEILGKPKDRQDAIRMLRGLSGRAHSVYTGVALLRNGQRRVAAERTQVFFRALSEREILAYVDSGEPMDKAGAYGIQGLASLFVERLEGDYFNVMGLPLCLVGRLLQEFGVELI